VLATSVFFIPIIFYRFKCKRIFYRELENCGSLDNQFVLAQDQHGAILSFLVYADYWSRYRSRIRIILLTSKWLDIRSLIQTVGIKSDLILPPIFITRGLNKLFQNVLQSLVFDELYKQLVLKHPNLIYIYEKYENNRTAYHSQYDPYLELVPKAIQTEYVKFRGIFDCRHEVIKDFYKLVSQYQSIPTEPLNLPYFASELGIKKPFVMLSINTKKYGATHRNQRSTSNLEFYEKLISCLHERGFCVVLFGGTEQPLLKSTGALINYAHSDFQSMTNDFILARSADFIISAKSGTEWLALLANRYMLGLNYTELSSINPNKFMRFMPKRVIAGVGREITWREYLQRPEFFEIGNYCPVEDTQYKDLESGMADIVLSEFCRYVESKDTCYSEIQSEFRSMLRPYHMDLYLAQSTPLDCYLNSEHDPS
jgi:putative glycosyltransferase (TIGR04372 family)